MRSILAPLLLVSCGVAYTIGPEFIETQSLHEQTIKVHGGSGVVVAPGVVLTAKHVVQDWPLLGIETVTIAHPTLDVAVVLLPTEGKTVVQVAPGSTFRGQEVFLVGTIMSRSQIHTEGRVGTLLGEPSVKVHSAASGPGASGAGIFDTQGRLVGIHIGFHTIDGVHRSPAESRFVEISAIKDWLVLVL